MKIWKVKISLHVIDAPESRTPVRNPRITPEFRNGSPA
jgi:hypothetical protein